jgi:hypothetical protein
MIRSSVRNHGAFFVMTWQLLRQLNTKNDSIKEYLLMSIRLNNRNYCWFLFFLKVMCCVNFVLNEMDHPRTP